MTSGSVVARIDPQYFADILLRIVPDLPQPVVESLWSAHRARCYSPAEFLQVEGEPSQGVFLIIAGLVRLSLLNDRRGKENVYYRELRAPAILGVNEVMSGSATSLTARAQTEVVTAFIPNTGFSDAARLPQAGLAFSQLIADELMSTYSLITELRGAGSV